VIILGQRDITRRRYAVGSRGSDGRWTAGAATDSTIQGSVQPADGDELATLPEGDRSKRARKVYTETELRTGAQEEELAPDRLVFDGEVWEVREVAREHSTLAHYKAIVVQLQEEG
jgi:hypothetical protein